MLAHFPTAWSRHVESIALYQGEEPSVYAQFFPKEKILGLYSPARELASTRKSVAVDELLLALAVVAERGDLPQRLSPSLRAAMLGSLGAVRSHCLQVVGENAA
jgi:hypothetical protein